MRRTTSIIAATLLGAALLTTPLAGAAEETCRGVAATIVGTGQRLVGTEGRDVMVTDRAEIIESLGGDDLICVRGPGWNSNLVDVDAGAGNDVVDSTAMARHYYLTAILGDGADTFVGGAGDETVLAGAAAGPDGEVPSEVERDVIETGAGGDDVTSGGPGLPNDDSILTGSGDDYVTWSGTMGAQGMLDGGDGTDMLRPLASGQTFTIDLSAQTITRDGVPTAAFSSFQALSVKPEPGLGTVEIIGTDGVDPVDVSGAAIVHADLRGGDDHLRLFETVPGSRLDLGAGTDWVAVSSRDGSVDLDLSLGDLVVDGVFAAPLAGIEEAYVSAREVTLTGNDQANSLSASGCVAHVDGRGGKDYLDHGNYDFSTDTGYSCDRGRVTLRGGSGNDRVDGSKHADLISGGPGNDQVDAGPALQGKNRVWGGRGNDQLVGGGDRDVLIGGAGSDRLDASRKADVLRGGKGKDGANGGPGRDLCRSEIRKSCER
ncbi:calcium-binding protein [Nocardioides piscis]|uniref:Calcium-binding protein n=1 Tax=Nocardioides piscis TaxID=2714938 RepID=A0A6G7YDE8_9ACTN|nr:calcium-binding protein [Nocardioides piscis]QIK74637.1 calcium-binding protein [Nocardioides piscis]